MILIAQYNPAHIIQCALCLQKNLLAVQAKI